MDEFEAIRQRMKELKLERDKPFAEPLAPDFHAELNAKLQPKMVIVPTVDTPAKYDQAAIEKAHGASKGEDGEYYYHLGPV